MPESNQTKRMLGISLKKLMNDTPFSRITVGDICENCGMSRKSFYYHFKDKYDLVNWIFYTEYMAALQDREFTTIWSYIAFTCEFLFTDRRFYLNALEIDGQNGFVEYFAETIDPIALAFMDEQIVDDEFHSFYCTFFGDAFRCALLRWLRDPNACSPATFASLCHRSIEGTPFRALRLFEQ